jgi:beta-glucosidase/6-phospho-beta-glucosidase/beta-galactosidase
VLWQTEPYDCAHNVLLAHAAAVAEFRRLVPDGKISMNINGDWAAPFDRDSAADRVRPLFAAGGLPA